SNNRDLTVIVALADCKAGVAGLNPAGGALSPSTNVDFRGTVPTRYPCRCGSAPLRERRGYGVLQPEYVARDDLSPSYQHRADPAADEDHPESEDDAPPPEPRPRGFDRQTHSERPVHHVQGDDALRGPVNWRDRRPSR